MNAHEFHRTFPGQKVRACVGNAVHCAKIVDKDPQRRKFLLRFHLANGDTREQWRSSLQCYEVLADDCPMGKIKRQG